MRRLIAIVIALAGCGGGSPDPPAPQQLYGEVHVHGFAGGSHPGALFLARATPASQVMGDEVVDDRSAPIASVGPCTLSPADCAGCAAPPDPIDGGPVHIRGGLGIADVELTFVAAQHAYLPTTPVQGPIFDGGEPLAIAGDGAAAPGFAGSLVAPVTLALTQPGARPRLDGDFTVAWVPDRATRIDVTLVASTTDGRAAILECIGDDPTGQAILPASLIAQLPAAPRDLQLVVSRDQIVFAPADTPGLGVVLHAGFEASVDWHEDP
jgi:hypothetical protein